MVRNYKRKTMRKAVQQDVLDQAKVDLQKGDSIRSIAVRYGMDESTLRKRLKKVFISCDDHIGQVIALGHSGFYN